MRLLRPLLGLSLLAVLPSVATAQAVVPEGHPGFVLAEAIAAQGCVLHQDDVNTVMEALELPGPAFPQFAVPLMRDGFLMSTGNGTLTLVNWGACVGGVAAEDAPEGEAEVDAEAAAETDADAETTGAQTE